MPRPKRDYGLAIRDDLEKLDAKIEELLQRRVRLQRMLADYENVVDVDLSKAVREFTAEPTKAKGVKRRRS